MGPSPSPGSCCGCCALPTGGSEPSPFCREKTNSSLSELFGVCGHHPDGSCSGCSDLAFGDPLSRGLCFSLLCPNAVTGSVKGLWVGQKERDLQKNSLRSVMSSVDIVGKATFQSRVCYRDGDNFIIFICLMWNDRAREGKGKGDEQIRGDQKIVHATQSNKLCCQQTQLPLDLSKDKTTIVYI